MGSEYREVTTTSWGKRMSSAFFGVIIGLLLFLGSFYLIWWNEGRSVERIKTLQEGRDSVVSVSPDVVDPSNQAALIHVTGRADTNDILKDTLFGVEENALKLKRIVEMYQWHEDTRTERHTNLGGSETKETVYTYRKAWSQELINSSGFKRSQEHKNPSSMPYKTEIFSTSNVSLGAFELTKPFTQKISQYEDYNLTEQNVNAMDPRLQQSFELSGNQYFYGDPSNPQIGAMRVSYSIIRPMEVTVVGQQNNDDIETYFTENGSIELLEEGRLSAENMFSVAESDNARWTWILRFGGFFMMWLGLAIMLHPLKVLGDVVPIIGTLAGMGISILTGLVALILSLITMAIAWIFFRPIIGAILLIMAFAAFFSGYRFFKDKEKPEIKHAL